MTNPTVGMKTGVYYRLMLRQSLFGRGSNTNLNYGEQSNFFTQTAEKVYFLYFVQKIF